MMQDRKSYDVIVVGARCAGSPLAMLLARKGRSVLLVDKSTFPSDTMSTHFIHPTGIARLKRWGLLEDVAGSGCRRIDTWTFDMGHATFSARPPAVDGVGYSYCPRRTVLDDLLLRAAQRAGAEAREGFTVREILTEGGRVVGIRGGPRGGPEVAEQAALVVGADGRRSVVAQAVGAPVYEERPVLCCAYYAYWAGVPLRHCEVVLRTGHAVFAFPTNDDLVCTILEWPVAEFDAIRADIDGSVQRVLDLAPALAARLRGGRRVRHYVGTADLPNYFRKPCGPGWALAGDAGHHRDPAGAYGISDAFRDAEQLVEAIDAGLSGRRPMDEALVDYERERNRVAMPAYSHNYEMAKLAAPSHTERELYAALAGNQAEADRFAGAILGTVPLQEFFSPENIDRIIRQSGTGKPGAAGTRASA